MTHRILVVDDDPAYREDLADYLETYGFRTERHGSFAGLSAALERAEPDLVILDQFLDGENAVPRIGLLRRRTQAGILLLTPGTDAIDPVLALESGADDFVSKLVPRREIVARLRAVLRRAEAVASPPTGWVLSRTTRELIGPDHCLVPLTSMEFDTLAYLHERAGETVAREDLFRAVLRRGFRPDDRAVDGLVSRIRLKLGAATGQRNCIRSIRGVGYVFTGFPAAGREPARIATAPTLRGLAMAGGLPAKG
ncbi:Response regulator transcription factor [Rhodovastum atsumiense]|nr:response regulator transcription factor [Rhodovastum atsumiense]CAH2601696.1 Response regulator transcription factor [Rhodovastum atsumiense]